MNTEELQQQNNLATTGVVVADVSQWTRIELKGSDRVKFLHNMSSNDIQKLAVGHGCEIFLLNAQGKILAFGSVFCTEDSLVIGCNNNQTTAIYEHLDRYLITEDVELLDQTQNRAQWLLAGPTAAVTLEKITDRKPPEAPLCHQQLTVDDRWLWVEKSENFGPESYLIQSTAADKEYFQSQFLANAATVCGPELIEVLRVESGMPTYGVDITVENLPQEIARDRRAINFNKGCYLGQETVARIDALGHVNRYLVGLKASDHNSLPEPGCELTLDEKNVGKITSRVHSFQLQSPLALGYVRRGHHSAGTELQSTCGPFVVVELPILKK